MFVLLGDGECEEGSVWEAALFAPKLGLSNLTAIVDCNGLQYGVRPDDICHLAPLADKWRAFGWSVEEVDGHSIPALLGALRPSANGAPRIVVARTQKGRGIPAYEDQPISHTRPIDRELRDAGLACLPPLDR